MIELTTFAAIVLILGLLIIPRTMFLVVWIFNGAAVSAVLGGSATVLAVLGFIFMPKVLMTYFLLESVAGAPASGSALYWIYIILAIVFDLGTKKRASDAATT